MTELFYQLTVMVVGVASFLSYIYGYEIHTHVIAKFDGSSFYGPRDLGVHTDRHGRKG